MTLSTSGFLIAAGQPYSSSHKSLALRSQSLQSFIHTTHLQHDHQHVTELYAEVIGTLAQTRFGLVKRRFLIEFDRLKLNIQSNWVKKQPIFNC